MGSALAPEARCGERNSREGWISALTSPSRPHPQPHFPIPGLPGGPKEGSTHRGHPITTSSHTAALEHQSASSPFTCALHLEYRPVPFWVWLLRLVAVTQRAPRQRPFLTTEMEAVSLASLASLMASRCTVFRDDLV